MFHAFMLSVIIFHLIISFFKSTFEVHTSHIFCMNPSDMGKGPLTLPIHSNSIYFPFKAFVSMASSLSIKYFRKRLP